MGKLVNIAKWSEFVGTRVDFMEELAWAYAHLLDFEGVCEGAYAGLQDFVGRS